MSSHASPEPVLNRKAVELALKWNGITLSELLPAWGVRVQERWPDHPLVADFVALTAVQVHQARGMAQGMTWRAALRRACGELGLSFTAVESRLRRAQGAYISAAQPLSEQFGKMPGISENLG